MSKDSLHSPKARKLGYSSQLAFVISLIAGSVGTGNIWRFPRVAAANGGAFVLAYIIMMFVVIIPVMMGEHFMGRRSRRGAPGTFKLIAGKKATWLGTIVAFIMAMTAAYYSAVLAWIVYYVGLSFTKGYYGADKAALFASVSNGNIVTVILFVLILGISAYICYKGVSGIEKANKIFIPILFVSLIIMAVRALMLPGATEGLNHYFGFQFGDLLNYKTWLEALTQAIWSAGPGWGLCITLAVFSKSRSDVTLTSAVNGLGDMFAAVLAGLAVIPALFAISPSAEEALAICSSGNNGLTFIAMTSLVEKMPGGYLMGILFFVSLLMAGLSSNICHFMICSLPLVDAGKDRKKSILGVFVLLLIWGLPSAWNSTFLSNQDWVAGQMMIVGVMFSCYAMIKFGVSKIRGTYLNNPYTGMKIGKWWEVSIRFIAPIIAGIMFVWWTAQCIGWEANWWNPFGVNNLGTFVFQGGLMAIIAYAMNKKVVNATPEAVVPEGELFAWDEHSTYVRKQTFFDGMKATPEPVADIHGARVLALLGDSVTTDHISPAGAFKASSPAGKYLTERGVEPKNFNSYGSRRGNHEIMVRGTFGNIRLRNQLLASVGEEVTPGGFTYDFTTGKPSTIFDASLNYKAADIPLVVLAGKEYGTGSSRDWAATGTVMLGVKAVITESFERIHRSNLIGMGVLPLQFPAGESYESLGLDGTETYDIAGVDELNSGVTPKTVHVTATHTDGSTTEFDAVVRIDTPGEADYYRNGGILQYVLRNLMK